MIFVKSTEKSRTIPYFEIVHSENQSFDEKKYVCILYNNEDNSTVPIEKLFLMDKLISFRMMSCNIQKGRRCKRNNSAFMSLIQKGMAI
jgi:hypothetical protein